MSYGDPDNNIVSLYGIYGNNEAYNPGGAPSNPAFNHYVTGVAAAQAIQPLCTDGTTNCPDSQRAIVFLFIGFSNCDIEICGGNADIWDGHDPTRLAGQPCATSCPNPLQSPPPGYQPWNQTNPPDGIPQQSFLYQVYSPSQPLVGPHVAVFDGAFGGQTLSTWVFPGGYYSDPNNLCIYTEPHSYDPECNYTHVQTQLAANGYDERQVQVVFLKSSTGNPQCDLKGTLSCTSNGQPVTPDAYVSERLMGKIMRYLKCCKADGTPRYANLKQVFITSRIYGGYADTSIHGCTINPEPFAYESGIAVQRLIVAQIKQAGRRAD